MGLRNDWKEVLLGDVLGDKGYIRGPFGSALKRGELLSQGPVPIYEQQHAIYGDRKFRFFIDEDKYEKMRRFTVQTNDIIISCSGTIGKASMINGNDPKGIISQALLILRADEQMIIPDYLLHFIKSSKGYHSITSRSSGSVQVNIAKRETIENIPILLPSVNEQRSIAATLSCIDKKIELNNKINANLEAQAQAIFKSWFVDFEPFQDGEFVESELGLIPKGWNIGKLTDVVDVLGGGTPKTDNPLFWNGDIPFFTPKDVTGIYTLTTEKYLTIDGIENCNSSLYPVNTVFITARGTVGKIAMAGAEMAMNQSCYALRGKGNNQQFWVYGMAHQVVKSLQHKSSGAVFNAIVTRDFSSEYVMIPSDDIIDTYQNTVAPLYNAILQNTKQSRTLATLRDTLLPKLMSGEIEVPVTE